MTKRRLLWICALTTALGCSDRITAPEYPDVLGDFGGVWTYQIFTPAAGSLTLIFCTGGMQITEQDGPDFSGRYSQDAQGNCTGVTGDVSGQIERNGAAQLTIRSDSDSDFEDTTGCTITERDDGYAGSLAADSLSVAFSLTTDCPT